MNLRPMRTSPMLVHPMRVQPMRFNTLVKTGYRSRPMANPAMNDRDFDGVPDQYDCNPYNALQQDDGSPKIMDAQYIPTEGSDQESYVISPEEPKQGYFSRRRARKSEQDAMKTARRAYDTAYGEDVHLFLRKNTGEWYKVDSWTSQEFSDNQGDLENQAESMFENPYITDYKFTTDAYFAEREQIKQRRGAQREQTFKKYSRNAQQAFKAPSGREAVIDRASYAQGPSLEALAPKPFLSRSKDKANIGNIVNDMNIQSQDYEQSEQPLYKMADSYDQGQGLFAYQERSPFANHVPFRPVTFPFVKKAQRRPLFKPPFLQEF